MSLILAIEPDSPQAERLRQLVREQVDAELMVVTSAYAATVAMNRQVPVVLLFGQSVAHRHQNMIVKHLRSLVDGEMPQSLTIPSLAPGEGGGSKGSRFGIGWGKKQASGPPDPSVFVEQLKAAVAAFERQARSRAADRAAAAPAAAPTR